jgi:penicillin-binding protein 1A
VLTVLRLIKRLASLGLILVAVASVAAASALTVIPQVGAIITANDSSAAELELADLAERSSMYASDGTFLTFLVEEQNREPITLDEIPQPVIDAVLSMEDAEFYQHDGVNFRAVFRALVTNINAGGIEQGGSTITQQLVKNAILGPQQDFDRKSTEAFYALRLERQLSKDEILERYLNTVYFGAGAYGVQAAAETYWGMEDVSELDWEHAALLAGLIRNPTRYDPTRNAEFSRSRRATVLDVLVKAEHLTEDQADAYKRSPLPAERQEPFDTQPTDYFIQEALLELLNDEALADIGETKEERRASIYFGGLNIYTTFDLTAQASALQAREEILPQDERGFTIAVASMDTHTSAVRAMVGGPAFQREQFNLTTQGLRQPGSSMKTFVLAALFEAGYTPRDEIRGDSPCKFDNPGANPPIYEVKGGGGGVQSIASVTRASNNCAFVRLGQVVGNDAVVDVAQRLGLTAPLEPFLSLPLGALEVHPIEMAGAYAAMGNDGIYNKPYYVERIEDRDGKVLFEHRANGRRAISIQSARLITETLASNVRSGTGTKARLEDGHVAAGKTGTAQNYEDAWFVGYTDCLTTAVWMGHPDEKVAMRNVPGWGNMFGGKVPAAVWGAYNNAYHSDIPEPCVFDEPEPYGGGRYLKVPGEIDFCNSGDQGSSTENTQMKDSDGDGKVDCFEIVTTTSEGELGGGGDEEGDPTNDGGGGTTTPPAPAPTTPPAPAPTPTAPPSSAEG